MDAIKISSDQERFGGGASIYEKPSTQAEEIPLNKYLLAGANSMKNFINVNICNIYIRPNATIDVQELENLLQQTPKPLIPLRDFNCHNVIRGCEMTNGRERSLDSITTSKY